MADILRFPVNIENPNPKKERFLALELLKSPSGITLPGWKTVYNTQVKFGLGCEPLIEEGVFHSFQEAFSFLEDYANKPQPNNSIRNQATLLIDRAKEGLTFLKKVAEDPDKYDFFEDQIEALAILAHLTDIKLEFAYIGKWIEEDIMLTIVDLEKKIRTLKPSLEMSLYFELITQLNQLNSRNKIHTSIAKPILNNVTPIKKQS